MEMRACALDPSSSLSQVWEFERGILYQYGYNRVSLAQRKRKASAARGAGPNGSGFGDAQTKLCLARKLNEIIDRQGLNQGEVAQLLGMPQPRISSIRNYKLRGISLQRLLVALTALGQRIEIVVTPSSQASRARINVAA
jgi:predicted XRE-type DNA-binding protein